MNRDIGADLWTLWDRDAYEVQEGAAPAPNSMGEACSLRSRVFHRLLCAMQRHHPWRAHRDRAGCALSSGRDARRQELSSSGCGQKSPLAHRTRPRVHRFSGTFHSIHKIIYTNIQYGLHCKIFPLFFSSFWFKIWKRKTNGDVPSWTIAIYIIKISTRHTMTFFEHWPSIVPVCWFRFSTKFSAKIIPETKSLNSDRMNIFWTVRMETNKNASRTVRLRFEVKRLRNLSSNVNPGRITACWSGSLNI